MKKYLIASGVLGIIILSIVGFSSINKHALNDQPAAVVTATSSKTEEIITTEKTEPVSTPSVSKTSVSIESKFSTAIKQVVEIFRGRDDEPVATPRGGGTCIAPPPDMISWWSGDTDGSDIEPTPNVNNGTLQNGTTIITGKVDNSFHFDGVNDYVQVPNNTSLTPSTNKFTFDFWMKPEAVTAAPKMLIYKGKEYRVMSDGAKIFFEVTNSSTGGKYISTTTSPLTLNSWNFVAVTFDGTTQSMQIYVNGNLIPATFNTLLSNGTVATLINQPTALRFGSDYGTSNYFKGNLDEIELFNRVLTSAEIQSIFNAGDMGKCKTVQMQQTCIPNTWTQKADFGGTARVAAVGFSIGDKGYIGTGFDQNTNLDKKDFWEWDQATNTWTQKADFGGGFRESAAAFSIGTKGYIGTGGNINSGNIVLPQDLWEYNPVTNIWMQKADFAGLANSNIAAFSIGTKGYFGAGYDHSALDQATQGFWEYNPLTNNWTQKADFGGAARAGAKGFSIGGTGYLGTGSHIPTGGGWAVYHQDFWGYNQSTNTWAQKTNVGGPGRHAAVAFSIGTKGYIGMGSTNGGIQQKDFWKYDPSTNTWTQKADFGGGLRFSPVGFSIGNKGYVGTGHQSYVGQKKDFWEYCPD